jgi:hypothetical protein
MRLHHRRAHVVDELQRLGEDEAVERPLGDARTDREVGHDRRLGVGRVEVEHVRLGHRGAEAPGVLGALHLQRTAANVGRVCREKSLDVVAVDRRTPVEPPLGAERTHAHRPQQ